MQLKYMRMVQRFWILVWAVYTKDMELQGSSERTGGIDGISVHEPKPHQLVIATVMHLKN